ncbi:MULTISPECIES: peptidoglycan-binding protein [unclassified Streptomyces]|uniref:peptidoglycan-binding protein n=1 Tax=unclassified Streptomyces TaxID=2593676 RepID=UPI001F0C0515|nr:MULTISPECIES: peptidoglycan-binding protein [unclassified Streptomyces]
MPLFPPFSGPYDGSPVALSGDGTDSARSVPYRCSGAGAAGNTPPVPPTRTSFPGAAYFGPGARNAYVRELGRTLVRRGAGRFCGAPPGPPRTDPDRRATRSFQEARGWRGAVTDGPSAWEPPVSGGGRNIPGGASASGPGEGPQAVASHGVPGRPGRASFRPGAGNAHVSRLGRHPVRKGFGRHHGSGPGPLRGGEDRRDVAAFPRARSRRGGAADGCPGPETWRRPLS